MTDKRKDCPMRHENGNCTVSGGFCTAVNDSICDALHNAFDCGCSSALRQQETVTKCNDLFDEDGGEILTDEMVKHSRQLNTPLTLDELRKLPIRDWVWIEILNPDAFRSKETVSAYYRKYDGYKKDEIFWCGYPGLGFGFDYADYGKTWLAYRQKPEEGSV